MSLITCCPSCATQFRVVADQLRISDGWVRCGHCQEVFDATESLQEVALPAPTPAPAVQPQEPASPPPLPDDLGGQPVTEPAKTPVPAPTPAAEPAAEPPDSVPVPELALDTPPEPAWLPDPVEDKGSAPVLLDDWLHAAPEPDTPTPPTAPAPVPKKAGEGAPWLTDAPVAEPDWEPEPLPAAPEPEREPERESQAQEPTLAPPDADAELADALAELLAIPQELSTVEPIEGLDFGPDAAPAPEALPLQASTAAEPVLEPEPASAPEPTLEPAAQATPAAATPEADRLDAALDLPPETPLPSFVRRAQRQARWNRPWVRFLGGLLLLLLPLALLAQIMLHERNALAAHVPVLRPWLEGMCQLAGCRVEPPRHIAMLVVSGSSFEAEAQPGRFRLGVSILNQSSVVVAMPDLELTLSDVHDQVLARKVLSLADVGAPPQLGPRGEWSISLPLDAQGLPQPVAGYRVLLFYP